MKVSLKIFSVVVLICASVAHAHHPCASPLILDLDGDGLSLLSSRSGVSFDINADGHPNRIGWPHEDDKSAFLWLDLDRDGQVDDGSELFGTATRLANGKPADNGFQALGQYDSDGDGQITPDDDVWPLLLLWIDADRSGGSEPAEIATLDGMGVLSIGLVYESVHELTGTLNVLAYKGTYAQRVSEYGRTFVRKHAIVDVVFSTAPVRE